MNKITLFIGGKSDSDKFHWMPNTYPLLVSRFDLDKNEVVVIDENIEKDNTISLIGKHVPSSIFLGISSSTGYQLGRSIAIAKHVKSRYPEIPIVWGGAHVTALPEESLVENFVDVVVVGRGDDLFPELVKGIKNKTIEDIPGVYFKKNGRITGKPNCEYSNLNDTPMWPYEILKIKNYINPETSVINLTTSWGCPNRCTFCYWYRRYNPWSGFSAERVYKEVKYFIEKYNIEKFYFLEADYFGDAKRSLRIADLIKDLHIKYTTNARISDIACYSENDFKRLEDSGCISISIGLESGSPKMLRLMAKKINLEEALNVTQKMSKTSITMFFTLLFQMPGEEVEDLYITHSFIEKLKNVNPNVRIQSHHFCPLPGLPATKVVSKRGYTAPKSMEGWINEDQWISGFEMRPWMKNQFDKGYAEIYNELFPEDDSMSAVYNKDKINLSKESIITEV